jgi:hypothetical protein
MTRRRWALGASAGFVASVVLPWRTAAWAEAGTQLLPRPASLADEIHHALALRKALVLMVSLDGCPYCKLVRESYLVPLRAEGQPVVQVELTRTWPLVDAAGRASTHVQLVHAFGARVAPSVLFLGRAGTEVAERLVGIASADFYGAYLSGRVEIANRAVLV